MKAREQIKVGRKSEFEVHERGEQEAKDSLSF